MHASASSFPLPPARQPVRRAAAFTMLVSLLLGAATGGFVTGAALRFIRNDTFKTRMAELTFDGWTVLLFVLIAWLVIAVHEAGHLLGGKLAGMRPLFLTAGPLQVTFTTDGARPELTRPSGSWGGLAVALPAPDARPRDLLPYVLGGPLGSLAVAVASAALFPVSSGRFGAAFLCGAVVGLLITLMTLVPMRVGGYASDGRQALSLLQGDPETVRRLELSAAYGRSLAGARPRELDDTIYARLAAETTDPSLRAAATLLAADIADDRGRDDLAAERMRALAAQLAATDGPELPTLGRQAFGLRVATWLAEKAGDAAAARAWLDASAGPVIDPLARAHAEAVVAHREGRADEVRAALAVIDRELPKYVDRGRAAVVAESVRELRHAVPSSAVA